MPLVRLWGGDVKRECQKCGVQADAGSATPLEKRAELPEL